MASCGDLFGGDLYEEEQAVELAKYIETLKNGEDPRAPKPEAEDEEGAAPVVEEEKEITPYIKEVSTLNEQGSYASLLDIFRPDMQLVFEKGTEEDIVGVYSIMYALCRKLAESEQAVHTTKLVEAVVDGKDAGESELRLKMLVNLYNSVDPSFGKIRFSVFLSLVDFCTSTEQVPKVAKHLGDIEGRVQAWKLSTDEQKEVYLKLAEALKGYQDGTLAQKFLVTFLSLWVKGDKLALAAPQAIEASVKAIQNPTTFNCDELLQLKAVVALADGDEKSKAVFRLLQIYGSEKLEAYEEFVGSHKELLASIGLTHEMCVDKLRLLSLASLAAENNEIPYDVVASTLKLGGDREVEMWVIKGFRAGLVQAKMDQVNRKVIVSRTTARVFNSTDWKELGDRVQGWRTSLTNMSQIIQAAKEHARAE